MKTIGFIDYYISEWHANNYPGWIKEVNESIGEDFVVKYAWAEKYVSPVDGRNTDEWCNAFGIEKCDTIQELCEKADYILILAPSDPQKHLEYAQEALKYRKNTYIDKTFAPDYATAKKIFDIANSFGTKFFSSSALRYATELDDMINSRAIITLGGGRGLEEYIIHQIEMVVKVMNTKALKVRVEKQGATQFVINIDFEQEKRATLLFSPAYGFNVCVENSEGAAICRPIVSAMFKGLIADILRFYVTGTVSFDTAQTLEVMKIREGILKAEQSEGEWIEL